MDYITKNDASFVKTSLIDFWLKNYTADLIANEVPFFKGNRRADLIMISNNNLTWSTKPSLEDIVKGNSVSLLLFFRIILEVKSDSFSCLQGWVNFRNLNKGAFASRPLIGDYFLLF